MSRPGLATCRGCLNSPAVCPCQPVTCPLLPKTYRSAGTCTERSTSQHVGQTRRISSKPDSMHPVSKEVSRKHVQQADIIWSDSGQKQRSYDVGCGFVEFCHKHIFATPTATASVSGPTRKVSQDPDTVMSSQSQYDAINAHFNPCFSNGSPPDDDDVDIDLDAASLCDSLYTSHTRKTHALPAVSEMSESCFEGLQSSSCRQVLDFPTQFRPLSWADPIEDCLIGSGCSCSKQPTFCTLKSDACYIPGAQLSNSASRTDSDELCVPLSGEMPLYWELERPSSNTGRNLASQACTVPENCQKLASPLRMGTLMFDASPAGNVADSSEAHATAKLPNKPSYQNACFIVDTAKAPKMGSLSARCCICRDCQHVCSPATINRQKHAASNRTSLPHEVHIPQACKCVKQRRCPTPPRMLSPCVDDDHSVKVPVADI